MKKYRGLEIKQIVKLMDEIMYSTDLTNNKHCYSRQLSNSSEVLTNDVVCLMTDDEKSFLLAIVDEDECTIEVEMWAGMNNKISFKDMIAYINALKGLLKDVAKRVEIIASFRTTTSLPIMQRLIKRYNMTIEYMGEETEDGYCVMNVIYEYPREY